MGSTDWRLHSPKWRARTRSRPPTTSLPSPRIVLILLLMMPMRFCASTGTEQERDRYLFNIAEPGTLYVHSTGTTDVVGILYGPDGTLIIEDDDGGDGMNFRIAVEVAPGLHLLEVKGQDRNEQGVYGLVSNFVAGPGGPTTPGTGTGTG